VWLVQVGQALSCSRNNVYRSQLASALTAVCLKDWPTRCTKRSPRSLRIITNVRAFAFLQLCFGMGVSTWRAIESLPDERPVCNERAIRPDRAQMLRMPDIGPREVYFETAREVTSSN